MNAASTAISPMLTWIIWLPWPTVRTTLSKVDGLFSGLLQGLEGFGAGIELAAGAGDKAAGFHGVDLDALLALGREAELGLGLETVGFGKGAQDHLAVADFDRPFVEQSLRGARCRQACSGFCPWGDEELNACACRRFP